MQIAADVKQKTWYAENMKIVKMLLLLALSVLLCAPLVATGMKKSPSYDDGFGYQAHDGNSEAQKALVLAINHLLKDRTHSYDAYVQAYIPELADEIDNLNEINDVIIKNALRKVQQKRHDDLLSTGWGYFVGCSFR